MPLKREIQFHAAYDRRDDDPKKNYGIHGVTMSWYLTGDAGTVQFVVYTNWHLPEVQKELDDKLIKDLQEPYKYLSGSHEFSDRSDPRLCIHRPMPADLGYHSKVPMYEGQETMQDDCQWTDGEPCYYDGSGLQAEAGFNILIEEGSEAVWKWMEIAYENQFE